MPHGEGGPYEPLRDGIQRLRAPRNERVYDLLGLQGGRDGNIAQEMVEGAGAPLLHPSEEGTDYKERQETTTGQGR